MKYSFVIEEKEEKFKKEDEKQFIEKLKFRNKISYLIISVTFGISSLSDLAIQYFFKDVIGLGPGDLSQITSIVMIPWFLKPFFGLLTDLMPICGYRRKWYIIICGIIDFLSFLLISSIKNNMLIFVCLLFLHNMCLSFQTVLGEAIVVELSKLNSEEGSNDGNKNNDQENSRNRENEARSKAKNYVSYFFFCKYLGTLFSSLFQGILVKHFSLDTVFLICAFIPLLFVLSGIILLEIKINNSISTKDDERELIKSIIKEQNELIVASKNESCPKKLFGFIFQRHIFVPILFTIIFVGTPSYSDPLFYFFTEFLKFEPVDLGLVSLFSTIATLIAILMYRCYFKKKTFKSMIIYGSLASFFISFSSYLLVMRYNIKLGIPDFVFIIFSSSLLVMIGELIAMPLLSLAAVLSPKNLEGTSYSVFMSAINFGFIASKLLGSLLTNSLGITKKDFSRLPELILIANFLSLFPLPFLICLKKSYFDPEIKKEEPQLNDHKNLDNTDNSQHLNNLEENINRYTTTEVNSQGQIQKIEI